MVPRPQTVSRFYKSTSPTVSRFYKPTSTLPASPPPLPCSNWTHLSGQRLESLSPVLRLCHVSTSPRPQQLSRFYKSTSTLPAVLRLYRALIGLIYQVRDWNRGPPSSNCVTFLQVHVPNCVTFLQAHVYPADCSPPPLPCSNWTHPIRSETGIVVPRPQTVSRFYKSTSPTVSRFYKSTSTLPAVLRLYRALIGLIYQVRDWNRGPPSSNCVTFLQVHVPNCVTFLQAHVYPACSPPPLPCSNWTHLSGQRLESRSPVLRLCHVSTSPRPQLCHVSTSPRLPCLQSSASTVL